MSKGLVFDGLPAVNCPIIYHGTPLTPRSALEAVMPGRAACISFYRPDDLEALLAICPQLMFRPRSVQLLDVRHARRKGMGRGRARRMAPSLLPLAGADYLSSRPLGDHAGQPCRTVAAERWASKRLAIRPSAWRPGLAHGRFDRSLSALMRAIPTCVRRVDWRSEARASRMLGLSS